MKHLLLSFFVVCLTASTNLLAQCTTTNATSCVCKDGSTNCDLIPNIKISYDLLVDPSENPETPGRIGVSVSTPNVGHGPLRFLPTDKYVCGTDTIISPGGLSACPDGSEPRNIVSQRIFQKNGNSMTYYDREAGTMTYHPTHGHMHFDDWGVYTLRVEVPGTDPRTWPIIGQGQKLGFCLMDFGSCDYYNGHCRDDNNNILTTNAPNYGLGGGSYSCGLTNQGISAGWVDIYHHYLDGMEILLPPGVCNGDYFLVVEVDPHDVLLEENESDNLIVAPITLTQQSAAPAPVSITANGSTSLCAGGSVDLSVPQIGTSYLWSNGETTSSISATTPGNYSCEVTTPCGTVTSNTVTVTSSSAAAPTVPSTLATCENSNAFIVANGSGEIRWYDAATGGNLLHVGNTFTSPSLTTNTTYYVANVDVTQGASHQVGEFDNSGGGGINNPSFNGWLIFNSSDYGTLESVKVYADGAANRTIQLRDNAGNVIQQTSVNVPDGESRVQLNFDLEPGTAYQLGTLNSPDFFRSSSANYPYSNAFIDITGANTGSSATSSFYYYFYDWEIKELDSECSSPRSPVSITVAAQDDPSFTMPAGPFCVTDTDFGASSITTPGGTWAASGGLMINGSTGLIDPSSATPGSSYTITYTTAGACPAQMSRTIVFDICSSIQQVDFVDGFSIQPNPAKDFVTISLQVQGQHQAEVEIFDLTGKRVLTEQIEQLSGQSETLIDISTLSPGVYSIKILIDDEHILNHKIVKH